jgi:hypothetical protein
MQIIDTSQNTFRFFLGKRFFGSLRNKIAFQIILYAEPFNLEPLIVDALLVRTNSDEVTVKAYPVLTGLAVGAVTLPLSFTLCFTGILVTAPLPLFFSKVTS